jgi:hypothetical protein
MVLDTEQWLGLVNMLLALKVVYETGVLSTNCGMINFCTGILLQAVR